MCASPAAYLGDMNANGQAQGLRKAAEGPSAGLVGSGVTVSLLPPWGIQRGDGTWSWAPLLDAPGLIPLDALTRALAQRLRRNGSRARVGAGAGITQHCPTLPSLPAEAMSDYENDDECWSALEGFRVTLTSVIDPSRITPYLRQCKVLNPDDEEQVLSDPNLVIRKRKVGVLLDILQRTGHKGYVAFLESLELYYPQLYKKVTGKEPARVFSMIIDASGESGLTQLLMTEVMKLQKKVQDLTALLSSKDDFIKELRVKDSLLRKHQERVQRLKEECEAGSRELKRCKEENYDLAMRLAHQSEEKGAALMRNRDLQLEIDRLKHSLMKAEDDCKVERKHTLKLRHAMEQRPSQELLWELQQEKALLQARVQELEASVQVGPQAGQVQPRQGSGGFPARPLPFAPFRRGSWTGAAPTSRYWRRTGGRRCGTTRSRPTPSSPCARTSARARPDASGAWRRRRCSSCSAWHYVRTPRCTRTASRPSCCRWRRSPLSGTRAHKRRGCDQPPRPAA
nr:caspase recruitment domain-containing protein 9 isoform X4 [Pan troglodytes]